LSDKVNVPYYGTLMTNVVSSMTGFSRYYHRIGRKEVCVALAGDGTTADIGFGAISAAAERGEKVLYICYDNEAYMNTGVQRSGTTPFGTWTNTTQIGNKGKGKSCDAKPLALLVAEHNVEYAATATLAYMEDLTDKLRKGKEAAKKGFAYIHVFTPCPTGWKFDPGKGIEITKAAVQTNDFPLWEARRGNYTLTKEVKDPKPIKTFLDYMKRFSHMDPEELKRLQEYVDRKYQQIRRLTDQPIEDVDR